MPGQRLTFPLLILLGGVISGLTVAVAIVGRDLAPPRPPEAPPAQPEPLPPGAQWRASRVWNAVEYSVTESSEGGVQVVDLVVVDAGLTQRLVLRFPGPLPPCPEPCTMRLSFDGGAWLDAPAEVPPRRTNILVTTAGDAWTARIREASTLSVHCPTAAGGVVYTFDVRGF